jgi:hypothetical protein
MPQLADNVPSVITKLDISHRVERTQGPYAVCLYGNHGSKTEQLRNTDRQGRLQQRKQRKQTLLRPSIPNINIQ